MKKPQMIFFDFGETLSKTLISNHSKGLEQVLSISNNPNQIKTEEILDFSKQIYIDIFKSNLNLEQSIIKYWNFILGYFNISFNHDYQELEEIYWDACYKFIPTENLLSFLQKLLNQNIRIAVISNTIFSSKTIERELKRELPEIDYEFVIASADYAFRKPNPLIFKLALNKANLSPCDTWHIGDKIQRDVVGAISSGIFPIRYTGAIKRDEPNIDDNFLEIDNWNKLSEYIDKL